MVYDFLYRGIIMSSIPGIHIYLSLEQVVLVFTTKLTFSEKSMLIINKNTTKIFKSVILTIFLAFFLVGAESQHEHVERCSQVHQDQIDELSILLLIVISTFSQFQLEFLDTCQIILHSFKIMRIERDKQFLQLHDVALIDSVEQGFQFLLDLMRIVDSTNVKINIL
jgi:fumarate reductase subunit D